MKRKLLLTLFVLIMSIGLMACNAEKNDETAEVSSEVVEERQTGDAVSETVSEAESEWVMPEPESVEEVQEQEISWYMDAEGVKSEELGIKIKRDNGIFDGIRLIQNVGVYTPHESGNGGTYQQNVFECSYHDGEFDSYISENGMQKSSVNGVEYAYKEDEYWAKIAIGGSGIIINSNLYISDFNEGETVEDYLNRIGLIKKCDDFNYDSWAYFTDEGLFCPVLGISLSIAGTEHYMNRISIALSTDDYTASIWICDESIQNMGVMYYMDEANNAQEVVDNYVNGLIDREEYSAIDETKEVSIGNYTYLGRGTIESDEILGESEEWLFYSDDETWSFDCDYDKQDGISYEDYLVVFEKLQ